MTAAAAAFPDAMAGLPLLQVDALSRRFTKPLGFAGRIAHALNLASGPQVVQAVDRVSLKVNRGEVLGLVGESGCGKSTLGRMVAGILPPSSGEIIYGGEPLGSGASARRRRALAIQMVFQDPYASLNPRMRVSRIIGQAPLYHGLVDRRGIEAYVAETMGRVGLDPTYSRRFPHQFSGGQRQRIGIARALALRPEFLICDEAVSALDVSIQAQILNLFMRLREELNLTYLFISHDLGVVRHLSDRLAVMYLGRIVEEGPASEVFAGPNHPYAQALLAEANRFEMGRRRYAAIRGEVPSAINPPSGCHFHPRCPHAMPRCRVEAPPLRLIGPRRFSACHLNDTA